MSRTGSRRGKPGQVRIIGGRWRGRKLSFPATAGLRPTGDRIRETLFNWLAPHILDARCADLFAGSGALGLEALSRGAAHCDFVDSAAAALSGIRGHLRTLDAEDAGRCHALTAQQFLQQTQESYNIVFVDPPFKLSLVEPVCEFLATSGLLADAAFVYIETASTEPPPSVPPQWALHREKVSGGVTYRLFRTTETDAGA